MQRILILALVLTLGAPGVAIAGPTDDVAAATRAWAAAYDSRDPKQAMALYDAEAVFWGTLSPTVRANPDAILAYFNRMPASPHSRVKLGEQHIRVYDDIAVNTGYYTFNVLRVGKRVDIPARFSFVYRLRNGRWMIVDHHSSRMPTPPKKIERLTQATSEVAPDEIGRAHV